MAFKKNTFTPHLKTMLRELSDLKHISYLTDRTIASDVKERQDSIKESEASGNPRPLGGIFGISTRFSMPDFQAGKPISESFWMYERESKDENLIVLVQETGYRMHGQILCQIFEAFEIHLIEIGANYFFQGRNDSTNLQRPIRMNKKNFNKLIASWNRKPHEGTMEYFRAYSKTVFKSGCVRFLNELGRTPGLSHLKPPHFSNGSFRINGH